MNQFKADKSIIICISYILLSPKAWSQKQYDLATVYYISVDQYENLFLAYLFPEALARVDLKQNYFLETVG